MIGRIAAHLADFSPRLRSNTRAIYQYCPMPHVVYPQLEAELFCSIFYLRHLCDTTRFPDWPIADPVRRRGERGGGREEAGCPPWASVWRSRGRC